MKPYVPSFGWTLTLLFFNRFLGILIFIIFGVKKSIFKEIWGLASRLNRRSVEFLDRDTRRPLRNARSCPDLSSKWMPANSLSLKSANDIRPSYISSYIPPSSLPPYDKGRPSSFHVYQSSSFSSFSSLGRGIPEGVNKTSFGDNNILQKKNDLTSNSNYANFVEMKPIKAPVKSHDDHDHRRARHYSPELPEGDDLV